jgi:ABC-type multidrug transport system fused ATPase/permease subunit
MPLSSIDPKQFHLDQGQVSAGLARDRLWQVQQGRGRIRLVVDQVVVGDMPIPEGGWFLVPESNHLRVQLVAESDVTFESRLPLGLIPRLGDLGRSQLVTPIVAMMRTLQIDDSAVDWGVKLAQPSFKSWFGEALDAAIESDTPLSPDLETPLVTDQAPRPLSEVRASADVTRAMPVLIYTACLAVAGVLSWLTALVVFDAPGFGLASESVLVAVGCVLWSLAAAYAIQETARWYQDVLPVSLAAAIGCVTVVLLVLKPTLALSYAVAVALIGLAYWVYVRRLLPDLPEIDAPMRWLSARLSREGVQSVRQRLLTVWSEASVWVIARIELLAEYSRFGRAVMAATLVIPAIALTDTEQPTVLTGLALVGVVLLERMRAAMPVSADQAASIDPPQSIEPIKLSGDVVYDKVVYRRHAGERPLFDRLDFECTDDSLVRITAPEGAGLSTLKHLLTRRVTPERGAVRIGGLDVARLSPDALAASVVMLDHPADAHARTVGEWLFVEPTMDVASVEHHLDRLDASHWIESLTHRLHAPIGALESLAGPHGINRLKLARALARTGHIIWLDHWLIGLSPAMRTHVIQSLVERPGTRFVVDRDGFLAEYATVHWDLQHA